MRLAERLGGARLVRFPGPASRDEYESAAREINGALQALPGCVAVYRTGRVSVPGISDLDLIAVVEPGCALPPVWPALAPRTRELALHSPFAVDVATFAHHRAFAHLQPLVLAWGEEVRVEERLCPEISEPLLAAEAVIATLLRLAKYATAGRIQVRSALCELHALRHDLMLGRVDRMAAPQVWRLVDEVMDLRQTWFMWPEPPIARLRGVLRDALPALAEVITALTGSLRTSLAPDPGPLSLGAPWSNVALVAGEPVGFELGWVPPVSWSRRLAELSWRVGRYRLRVPHALVGLLAGNTAAYDAAFSETRHELVRRYRDFLAAKAPTYSPIGFAWLFLPR